jgi:hypothetical protein
MNWSLISFPAHEELMMGYAPAPQFLAHQATSCGPSEDREMRRFLVTWFVIFGLLAGLQNSIAQNPAEGQRRIAEVNLTERKPECRNCGSPLVQMTDADL